MPSNKIKSFHTTKMQYQLQSTKNTIIWGWILRLEQETKLNKDSAIDCSKSQLWEKVKNRLKIRFKRLLTSHIVQLRVGQPYFHALTFWNIQGMRWLQKHNSIYSLEKVFSLIPSLPFSFLCFYCAQKQE
jgi:hypothetical protein